MVIKRLYRASELAPIEMVEVGENGGDTTFRDLTAAGGTGGQSTED